VGHGVLFPYRLDTPSARSEDFGRVGVDLHMFRWVADYIQDGLVVTMRSAESDLPVVVYANPAFIALSGLAESDLHPPQAVSSGSESWPPRDNPVWKNLEETHHCNDAMTTKIVVSRQSCDPIVLRLRSEPVYDSQGCISHRIAVLHDITEQTNLEDVLRRNERLAGIGLLAAGIAHEISNPVGSVLLAAETALAIMDSPQAAPQVAACLRNILTSADRCGRIVRTLMRYSREEPTERQSCSINDVAKQAVELVRPYAERPGTELRLELDHDMPLVPMNPLEIELVLVNLLRNAVEAGGGTTVTIRTEKTDGGVRATVCDKGCGMSEQQLAHVFDPLYTTRRELGGCGLGMNIASGIIRGHQGRMEVQSQLGLGTTVTIELMAATSRSLED
jgi:signal transduction histidine kinase